jgi:hypothetical protein
LLSGLQGSGDCITSNNWGSPEDECIWCWEQGYSDTQGHGSNSSYVFCYYSVMSLQFFSETFTVSSFLYLLPFVSILQSFWRNLISAEQSTHAHIYFGLMIRMASRMGKGAVPFCLKPLYSTWITVQFYPWTNHSSARTSPRDRCSYFWTCIIAIIQCCSWPIDLYFILWQVLATYICEEHLSGWLQMPSLISGSCFASSVPWGLQMQLSRLPMKQGVAVDRSHCSLRY